MLHRYAKLGGTGLRIETHDRISVDNKNCPVWVHRNRMLSPVSITGAAGVYEAVREDLLAIHSIESLDRVGGRNDESTLKVRQQCIPGTHCGSPSDGAVAAHSLNVSGVL